MRATLRQAFPRPVVALVLLLLALEGAVLWSQLDHAGSTLHRAPLRISAPAIVATSLTSQANALPGHPLRASTARDAQAARDSVTDGRAIAAVVVDLARSTDTVYVATANGRRVTTLVEQRITPIEAAFGRQVVVKDLVPPRAHDDGHRWAYVLVGVWLVIGFGVSAGIAAVRGPVAANLARGVARVVGSAVGSLLAGFVTAALAAIVYPGHVVAVGLIGALTVFAAAMTTAALEGLAGLAGLGLATVLVVLLAAPGFGFVHPLLMPRPWSSVSPWTAHGASLAATTDAVYFGSSALLKPVLVLAAWSALSVLTVSLSRRERSALAGRDAVTHDVVDLPSSIGD